MGVLAVAVAAIVPTTGVGATNATTAKPANFKVIINGKQLTPSQLAASADTYFPVRPGRVTVGVRWTNDIRNSGYYVLVSDMGSTDRRRCTVGTSCVLTATKPLVKTAETGYAIRIVQVKGNRVLSNKTVCVMGK
jgi:hypothetical protein